MRQCKGPVYYADQGIVVCEVCKPFGCVCCDHVDVDHEDADYRCLEIDGACILKNGHNNHDCEKMKVKARDEM